jgi:hypothetical protein
VKSRFSIHHPNHHLKQSNQTQFHAIISSSNSQQSFHSKSTEIFTFFMFAITLNLVE